MSLTPDLRAALTGVTNATLTTVLVKKALRNCWIRGAMPLTAAAQGTRVVGEAFTLRFIPMREDLAGVEGTGLPVWAQGRAAPASIAGLTFVGWNEPVACGGVAVFAGDVIVADTDGAVVIPKDIVAAVTEAAVEQDAMEAWIMEEARNGAALPGLYPMNAKTKARYDAFGAGKG